MCRCSQPLPGLLGMNSGSDEAFISAVRDAVRAGNAAICRSAVGGEGVAGAAGVAGTAADVGVGGAAVTGEGGVGGKVGEQDGQVETKAAADGTSTVTKVYIMDARPKVNAVGNSMLGKGYEGGGLLGIGRYTEFAVEFMGIENIHVVRSAFEALLEDSESDHNVLINTSADSAIRKRLVASRWFAGLVKLLRGATRVAGLLGDVDNPAAVIVHCSDGWDRTPQVTALAQVMLDPYYRTPQGFASLVAREWCAFGHQFRTRIRAPGAAGTASQPFDVFDLGNKTSSEPRSEGASLPASSVGVPSWQRWRSQSSPVFLQFLDAVWQVMQRSPQGAFGFGEAFLLDVLEDVYSGWWAAFECDSDKERHALGVGTRGGGEGGGRSGVGDGDGGGGGGGGRIEAPWLACVRAEVMGKNGAEADGGNGVGTGGGEGDGAGEEESGVARGSKAASDAGHGLLLLDVALEKWKESDLASGSVCFLAMRHRQEKVAGDSQLQTLSGPSSRRDGGAISQCIASARDLGQLSGVFGAIDRPPALVLEGRMPLLGRAGKEGGGGRGGGRQGGDLAREGAGEGGEGGGAGGGGGGGSSRDACTVS